MKQQNDFKGVPQIKGQQEAYIYHILNDINKFKILLVFINKGFTWHRELKSFGIYNNIIEETLNEFNNLGLIDLKELTELDNTQYETLKGVKQDIQHYFKIYFTNNRIFDLISKFQDDIDYLLNKNQQLKEFTYIINEKLKPFMIKSKQIMREENNQLSRKVTLNGISFEKETELSFKVKEVLNLIGNKQCRDLIISETRSIALMTPQERRNHTNKVFHNSKEVSQDIFREQKEKDKEAEKDFKDGHVGKSLTELEFEREKQDKDIFNMLGIE